MRYNGWAPYVPVAKRRAQAKKAVDKMKKQGKEISPVEIQGSTIAKSFWGKGWCDHLESFSDYENRLPRGRMYVRNGSVCHLEVKPGRIEAKVSGSSMYDVAIEVKPLPEATWESIKKACAGGVGSMLELLQGKLSKEVMKVVADREKGLFPKPREIKLSCSCPDWAVMCKHVAAVLYGVGNRLDLAPELLFLLRGLDAQELIAAEIELPAAFGEDVLRDDQISDVFGIDLDEEVSDRLVAESAVREESEIIVAPPARQKKSRETKKKNGVAVPKVQEENHGYSVKPESKSPSKSRRKAVKASKSAPKSESTAIPKYPPTKSASVAVSKPVPESATKPKVRPTAMPIAKEHNATLTDPEITGTWVKALREKHGVSGVQFAKLVDVSPSSIYCWETLDRTINLPMETKKKLMALWRNIIS